jgi:hypothetical protein
MSNTINTELPKNADLNVKHHQKQIVQQHIHQQRIHKGHKMYEVDIDDESVSIVEPEHIAIHTPGAPLGDLSTQKKLVTRINCLYISCLNVTNLKRLIDRAGGKDISSYTFKSEGKDDRLIKDMLKK